MTPGTSSHKRYEDSLKHLLAAPAGPVAVGAGAFVLSLIAGQVVIGPELRWSLLYLLPLSMVALRFGTRSSVMFAVATIAAAHAAVVLWGTAEASGMVGWLNELIRLVGFVGCVLFVSMLRRAYLRERHMARHDSLTGALNRRAFQDDLRLIGRQAARSGSRHLLYYLDLDGFKGVNDRHGHEAGDAVLRHLAVTACSMTPPPQVFARTGGDEFVILVRQSDELDPYTQAFEDHERLTEALRSLGHEGLGVSMGVVIIEAYLMMEHMALVRWADALMYEVKRAGKGSLRIGHAEPIKLAA